MLGLLCLVASAASAALSPTAFSPAEVAAWLLQDCTALVCEASSPCRTAVPCGELDGVDVRRAAEDLRTQHVDGLPG